jgi:hypothetical protein
VQTSGEPADRIAHFAAFFRCFARIRFQHSVRTLGCWCFATGVKMERGSKFFTALAVCNYFLVIVCANHDDPVTQRFNEYMCALDICSPGCSVYRLNCFVTLSQIIFLVKVFSCKGKTDVFLSTSVGNYYRLANYCQKMIINCRK